MAEPSRYNLRFGSSSTPERQRPHDIFEQACLTFVEAAAGAGSGVTSSRSGTSARPFPGALPHANESRGRGIAGADETAEYERVHAAAD